MQIVKLSFESENGKYKFYTTAEQLLNVMEAHDLFTDLIVDAKTGEKVVHKDRIIEALAIKK